MLRPIALLPLALAISAADPTLSAQSGTANTPPPLVAAGFAPGATFAFTPAAGPSADVAIQRIRATLLRHGLVEVPRERAAWRITVALAAGLSSVDASALDSGAGPSTLADSAAPMPRTSPGTFAPVASRARHIGVVFLNGRAVNGRRQTTILRSERLAQGPLSTSTTALVDDLLTKVEATFATTANGPRLGSS